MRKVQMKANPMRNKPSVLNDNDTKGHRAVHSTQQITLGEGRSQFV